jgi:hypothetical protein
MLTAERPMAMSRRTFANYQKSAIQTFAFLFLQAEAGRRQRQGAMTLPPPVVTPPLAPPSVVSQPLPIAVRATATRRFLAPRGRGVLLSVGVLLVVVGLIGALLLPRIGGAIAEQSLFQDDFENGMGQWWLQERNLWSVRKETADNHVLCVRTGGNYTYALAGSTAWRDYIIQLDLKIVTAADNGSGNLIWHVADELTLDKNIRGFPEKQWVPIRIEIKEGQMAVFHNDETTPILQASDANPITQGSIGLGAGFPIGEGGGVWEICFDNVRVTKF